MPAQRPEVARLLESIARALQPLGIRWYVFGAQAVIAAGFVRFTSDIDITVQDTEVAPILEALRHAGFRLRTDIAGLTELIEQHRILPLEHAATGFRLDVVRAGAGPEEQMLQRARMRRVGRRQVPYVDTNDLVVLKILAGREKDLEDVRSLMRTRTPELQPTVVRQRLSEFERLLDDSTLVRLFEDQVQVATGPTRRLEARGAGARKPRAPRRRASRR